MVSREFDGLAGAGGVKDVCRQLAETLVQHGNCDVSVLLPRYGFMDALELGFTPLSISGCSSGIIGSRDFGHVFEVEMNYPRRLRREKVAIWKANLNEVSVFLVEAERFGSKGGVYTYTAAEETREAWQKMGSGHYDYFAMNILLQKAALDLMILLNERPDVIHCQDGHAAILPAMMREKSGYRHYFRQTGGVVTIHNAGAGYHQEVEDLAFARAITGLPKHVIMSRRLGAGFDPFVAAAGYAVLNTVSENYGVELQQSSEDARTGWLGHALLDRGVQLAGVTNGINPDNFDPSLPEKLGLAEGFNPGQGKLAGKKACKNWMLQSVGSTRMWEHVEQFGTLDASHQVPLFTFIGRLTAQKGVDILLKSLNILFEQGKSLQLLVLGSGAPELEGELQRLTIGPKGAGNVCFLKGYDPLLANKVYAAGDFFVIPSRYEPCGLTDYMAQLMGNLPIVHYVGGLVKVVDGDTGFTYVENTPAALGAIMDRALEVYRDDPGLLLRMQQQAVARIFKHHTWQKVMSDYMVLYEQAIGMSGRDN